MCLRTSKYLVPRSWVATHGGPDPDPGSYFGPQNGHPPEVPNRLVAMIPVALWRNYLFPIPPCNAPLGHVRRSTGNRLELTPACRPSDPQNGVRDPRSGVRGPGMGPIWDPSETPSAMHSHRRHSGEPSLSLVPWWPLCGAYRPGGQRRPFGHGHELARTCLGHDLGSQIMTLEIRRTRFRGPDSQIDQFGVPKWTPRETPNPGSAGGARWHPMEFPVMECLP